jgi:hypothetical protein
MFKLIASCTVLGCLCACAATLPPVDEFTAAWNEGEHNENRTADGAAYIQVKDRWLGPALTRSTFRCSGEAAHKVRLVVQLNLDGSVRKAMLRPSSPYWECVKDALVKKTFPAPPRDGFWTSTTLN